MLRSIVHTFTTRFAGALISFLVVWLTARFLGAEIRGEISLLMLNITIITLINNVFGGPAMVFLVPRYKLFRLLITGYIWILFSSFVMSMLIYYLNHVSLQYLPALFLLSLISSYLTFNLNLLLGLEKIKQNNFIYLTQLLFLILPLAGFIFFLNIKTFTVFIYSLYISYGLAFIISFISIAGKISQWNFKGLKDVIKNTFKHGFLIQLASVIQLLNYRYSYYIIESLKGTASLGVYSVAISIAEAVWLISKSISMVQYSKISNLKNPVYAQKITINMFKLSLVASALAIFILLLLPASFYSFVFGKAFTDIKPVILYLSPGILFLALSTIFTHYFSGLGKNHINTIASSIGLVFTIVFCLWLIPIYGIAGAAAATSFSYFSSLLYLSYQFVYRQKVSLSAFNFTRKDLSMIRSYIKK